MSNVRPPVPLPFDERQRTQVAALERDEVEDEYRERDLDRSAIYVGLPPELRALL